MSKNVGLMRTANPQVALQKGNGQGRVGRLDLDRATPQKKVEPVEISVREARSPGALLHLAGIDAGDSCSRMSARVAEILARPQFGRACLVNPYFHSLWLCEGFGLGNPLQRFGHGEEVAR